MLRILKVCSIRFKESSKTVFINQATICGRRTSILNNYKKSQWSRLDKKWCCVKLLQTCWESKQVQTNVQEMYFQNNLQSFSLFPANHKLVRSQVLVLGCPAWHDLLEEPPLLGDLVGAGGHEDDLPGGAEGHALARLQMSNLEKNFSQHSAKRNAR